VGLVLKGGWRLWREMRRDLRERREAPAFSASER
jgi:hypothetical protein